MMFIYTSYIYVMNIQKQPSTASTDTALATPVAAFTVERFREDVANIVLHYLRALGIVVGDVTLDTPLTRAPFELLTDDFNVFSPERTAADLDLTYEHVRETSLACLMEVLYEFAFHGRLDASAEAMEYGSGYTWLAALLMDACEGHVAEEWDGFGARVSTSAENCLHVAELANARHILEGGEGVSYFSRTQSKNKSKDNDTALDALSIHQLALLAGMEEMSVRAAANPKRANPLKTKNEDGRTRITREDAKTWLQAKGRYLPVVRYWSAGEIDLRKRSFKDPYELFHAINARRALLVARPEGKTLTDALTTLGVKLMTTPEGERVDPDLMSRFDDEEFMTTLGGLLELPAKWLVLRAREAFVTARLRKIERELNALKDAS